MASKNDLALDILNKTLEAVVDHAGESVGPAILEHLIGAALAEPVSKVIAAVAKVAIGKLFEETSAIEKKLDRLLAEPFESAVTTVQEVLSVEARSENEKAECTRQLRQAFTDLRRAYTFARYRSPAQKKSVRIFQAFVAGLLPGARPFAHLYVQDLQKLIDKDRVEAASRLQQASQIRKGDWSEEAMMRREAEWAIAADGIERRLSFHSVEVHKEREKERLAREAGHLLEQAKRLDLFCRFVLLIADRQDELLASEKDDRALIALIVTK